MTYAGSLLLLAAIGLVALVAGRLYVGAFGADLFRRFDAAGAAAALAVGAAVLTLLSVWLSAAGLSAPAMLPLVAALQLVPLALAWRRRRLDALRPRGSASAWLSLLLPAATTALLALLPLLRADGYAVGNDTYTYSAFSEWLQGHGFSEPCRPDVQSPVTGIPALWQSQHYDLGIAHWLALVQAATRAPIVLLVYPATAAFGMVLLASLLWLVARQMLRLGRLAAGASALLFAAVPHALYWGHHNGFLQQTYALPLLLLALVLTARITHPRRWSAATAALVALPVAFLVAVYLPLLPTLVLAMAVGFVPALVRARGRSGLGRLAAFACWAALVLFLLAGRDLVGAIAPLHGFAANVSGGHVPFGAVQFFQFALGTRTPAPGWTNVDVAPWSVLNRVLAPAYAVLVVAGLWQAWRRARWRALGAAASVLFLGIGYYALAVKDPWSGRLGHTWNVFKLTQWACPFVLLLGVVGLRRLAAGLRSWRLPVLAVAWALPCALLAVHWVWARQLGETMQEVLPGPAPLRELPALKRAWRDLPAGTLLLVAKPSNGGRWLGAVTSLLAYPRAIVGDWTESASMGAPSAAGEALYTSLLSRLGEPFVVPVLAGFVPFQTEGVELLGGGFARLLPGESPVIVHVMNPAGFERNAGQGRPSFPIGEGRTKIVVLSRSERPTELALTLRAYAGRPGSRLLVRVAGGDYSRRAVHLAVEGAPDLVLPLGGETAFRVPLPAAHGLQTGVLVVEDRGSAAAARTPLTVVGLQVSQAASSTPVASAQPRP